MSIRSAFKAGEIEKSNLFKNHPRVSDCEEYIEVIENYLNAWGYDSFFLACDGREFSESISAYFGDKCKRMSRPLMHYFESDGLKAENRRIEFENYSIEAKTEDYLVETLLLAKCDSLYASVCSQSRFAYLYACDRYKYVVFDEKGRIL